MIMMIVMKKQLMYSLTFFCFNQQSCLFSFGISHFHDDIIKWKHFPLYWPFVRRIHLVNSPHKGQWHRALMFSLICVWLNGWINNCELTRYHAHYDVTVICFKIFQAERLYKNHSCDYEIVFCDVSIILTKQELCSLIVWPIINLYLYPFENIFTLISNDPTPGHSVTHTMTAELSYHVQSCSLIWSVFLLPQLDVFLCNLNYELINHLRNGSTGAIHKPEICRFYGTICHKSSLYGSLAMV